MDVAERYYNCSLPFQSCKALAGSLVFSQKVSYEMAMKQDYQ